MMSTVKRSINLVNMNKNIGRNVPIFDLNTNEAI
jgi:hypothetical protein